MGPRSRTRLWVRQISAAAARYCWHGLCLRATCFAPSLRGISRDRIMTRAAAPTPDYRAGQ